MATNEMPFTIEHEVRPDRHEVRVWVGSRQYAAAGETFEQAQCLALQAALTDLLKGSKIIQVDNYDRERMGEGDRVVVMFPLKTEAWIALLIEKALQDNPKRPDAAWYRLVDGNHKLHVELP